MSRPIGYRGKFGVDYLKGHGLVFNLVFFSIFINHRTVEIYNLSRLGLLYYTFSKLTHNNSKGRAQLICGCGCGCKAAVLSESQRGRELRGQSCYNAT